MTTGPDRTESYKGKEERNDADDVEIVVGNTEVVLGEGDGVANPECCNNVLNFHALRA